MAGPTDGIHELLVAAKEFSPILQELTTAYLYLSEAEQTLVRYILEDPYAVVNMSTSELASATGVSQATLFRTFRQFSFGGYAALRDELQRVIWRMGEGFARPIDARVTESAGMDAFLDGLYLTVRAILDTSTIEFVRIEEAARALATASRVHLCGIGPISGGLIDMLAFSFQRMGIACMTWTDPSLLTSEDQPFSAGDALFVLSHSGVSQEIAHFMRQANEQAAVTIVVSNYRQSLVAQCAQIPLITNIRELRIQNYDLLPRATHMVLLQVLVNLVGAMLARGESVS